MIINGSTLLGLAPIKDMIDHKSLSNGLSYGLTEIGYDIRIAQTVELSKNKKFVLASAIEEFQMPTNLMGRVCDKSSMARKGIGIFNTVIQPGWKGFLTLELCYHGEEPIKILEGTPIAQIIFEDILEMSSYLGKYQNQENKPVEAK